MLISMSVTHRDRIGSRVASPEDEVLDWLVRQRAWELRLAQLEGASPRGLAALLASSIGGLPGRHLVVDHEAPAEPAVVPDRAR
jgi:hypothetical protein